MDYLKQLLELNFQRESNEKIKISPIGEVVGFDERAFDIKANAVMSATIKDGIDLVIDVNHGYSEYGDKASGWIKLNTLEVRDDGIYASIEWTKIGQKLLKNKYYKYLSPAYVVDNKMNVLFIDSVGLVNKPNLLKDKLVNKKENNNKDDKDMKNDEYEAEIEALKKRLKEQSDEIEELRDKLKNDKVDSAISVGELMPNKKDFALSLNDKSLDEFLSLNKKDLEHLKTSTPQKQENAKSISDEQKIINSQLGLEEEGI